MADTINDRLLRARLKVASGADSQPTQASAQTPTQPTQGMAQNPAMPAQEPTQQSMDVEIGGATLKLPSGSTPEQVQSAIEGFKQTPEFDSLIDKETGAPARVRLNVGGALTPEDKLATLKLFYPDASMHGDGNFVYADPATGKLTLMNPVGFDVGDVAGAGREISQAVGGTLGAVAGTGVGAIAGLPTGPGAAATATQGAIVGAGLGTAFGGEAFDLVGNLMGVRVDTRHAAQRLLDVTVEGVAGAVGQRVGDLFSLGAKRVMGGGKELSAEIVRRFSALGVDPSVGIATGSRVVGSLEKGLEVAPFSADIMQKQANTVVSQVQTAANNLAESFGAPRTPQGAGEAIRHAAAASAERFGFTQEKIYTQAFDLIGAETPVVMKPITALRQQIESKLANAPRSLSGNLQKSLDMLKNIEADAMDAGGAIRFDVLREIRTAVGKDLADPLLSGTTSAQNSSLKQVYGALTEALSETAKASSPASKHVLEVADRFTRGWMNTAAKTMQKINDFDADEKAFKFVMNSVNDGGTAVTRLRRHFTDDEWGTVAASVLQKMGRARPGAQDATGEVFSPSTFLTNWNKMAPESKTALFGGKQYADLAENLDNLVKVSSSIKEMEKLTNTSNTARNLVAFGVIQSFGAAIGGLAGGDVQSAAGGLGAAVVGGVIAPRYAAKLITSPAFLKWMTTPVTNPNGISQHVGRLVMIAGEDEALREPINAFISALKGQQDTTEGATK